ncbi:hypothetical protein SCUCBS95973_008049 [Sporothrix curviconia]|uniref:Aminoglycoside phosphotransferase domain-containing protein n=1 Tax=Sporothrix curviconia TaxID=1260050 RepID=A0ABP0CIP7_9PEZI
MFSSYAPSTIFHGPGNSSRILSNGQIFYDSSAVDSADSKPRGSWLAHHDYRIVLSLDEPLCSADVENGDVLIRPGSVPPRCLPKFEDLSLADIEALKEIPGSSGRRQSTAYHFGQNQVIKVSPHQSILYEARVLDYIRHNCPAIPVPRVFGVRQLCDAVGRVRFCMLIEYIDGISADEAACEWSAEETLAFMHSVQSARQTLAATTSGFIEALGLSREHKRGDCEMSDDWAGTRLASTAIDSKEDSDTIVQDELFDHIWQTMDHGPFVSEADFVAAVGVALQRRGAGAARLNLVRRMVDQISKSCLPREPFTLQHANLTLGNFLVRRAPQARGGGTPEIVGVLGWGQAGFYPVWWELAKMAASEDRVLMDLAAQDEAFPQYSQHASVMLHVRDIIY